MVCGGARRTGRAMGPDIQPQDQVMAYTLDKICGEAERRHRYICDGKLTAMPGQRDAEEFKCEACGATVSISGMEIAVIEAKRNNLISAKEAEITLTVDGKKFRIQNLDISAKKAKRHLGRTAYKTRDEAMAAGWRGDN